MAESSRELQATAAVEGTEEIRERIIDALRTVFDPEIPVNIYELGLIYDITVEEPGDAHIRMTLTSPMCPVAEELPPEVETKARSVEGVRSVRLDLVWDPPWSPAMMSEAAKLELGML
jgi:FeS assembly SUF system protein